MWRRRTSLTGSGGTKNENEGQCSIVGNYASSFAGSFYASDPKARDRTLIFTVEVPTIGPLGLDLRARHVERGKPQRGAILKGFRPVGSNGEPGYIESTGRVKPGDILSVMHTTNIDDFDFDDIVQLAIGLQQDTSAWPLKLEFRREPEGSEGSSSSSVSVTGNSKPKRSSLFRSSVINPAQDGNFNEKLQYFRGFFANRMPTGGNPQKSKDKPKMPSHETVNEMYRDLLLKRGVPDDVLDELVRIEPVENKWHVVWSAQQNENDNASTNAAAAVKIAENLVQLKWDNKGLKDLEDLLSKLSSGTSQWANAFLDAFGLDYLTMKLPDPSPFPIEQNKYEKATRICEIILQILRSLTHFTAGIEAITNVPGLIKRVALCFHTDDGQLKKSTLQLLGIVCYNSAVGHQAVIEAFDHYMETKGETIRFSCLRDALKSTRYSLVFKEDVLSFVNIIVNKAIRLEDRIAIRSDFMALKMTGYFEEVRAKSLAAQRQKQKAHEDVAITNGDLGSTSASTAATSTAASAINATLNSAVAYTASNATSAVTSETPSSITSPDAKVAFEDKLPSATLVTTGSPPRRTLTCSSSTAEDSLRMSVIAGGKPAITVTRSDSVDQLRTQLDNMEKQIEVFETFMEDDRKDTLYEQTDLASIESVFESLKQNILSDQELNACLLSILQQLLFIPADRVVGKEMWALCERLTRQVALLAPIEEVRNFELTYEDRKALLKLRDRFTEFLQKTSEKDFTLEYSIGPLSLIQNCQRDQEEELEDFLGEDEEEEESEGEKIFVKAQEHPDLIKYFKLLKMGMPKEQVAMRLEREVNGFDGSILDDPEHMIHSGIEMTSEQQSLVTKACEHEKYVKYFKLMKMGMPREQIQQKMVHDGVDGNILDTPDVLLDTDGNPLSSSAAGIPVKDHEKFAKFFKLLKMGMPMEHVKLKASSEGLNAAFLQTPDKLLDEEGVEIAESYVEHEGIPIGMPLEHMKLKASSEGLDANLLDTSNRLLDKKPNEVKVTSSTSLPVGIAVKDHEKYAKFFKLLKMGMPLEQIKMKASMEGLKGDLLDTPDKLLDAEGKEMKPSEIPVKEHEKYAKFFKLLKMGMPMEHVKLKATALGLNDKLLETPDKLLDEEGKEVGCAEQGVKALEHPDYSKYFKLMKMGMPRPQLELKMKAEGLNPLYLDTPDVLVSSIDSKEKTKPVLPPSLPPKPKLRNLYWQALPPKNLDGTIWSQFESCSKNIFKEEEEEEGSQVLEDFIGKLSDIFVNKPPKPKSDITSKKSSSMKKHRVSSTRVALIDVKRANNIGIMLARFRLPYHKIRDAVLCVDKEVLSIEKVSALIQFAPEDTEIEAVKSYTGDPKRLGDAEQYFYEMLSVPRLLTRLQAIHATFQFDTYVEEEKKIIQAVCKACQEIKACKALYEILKVILSLGNALNDGTIRGQAKGFKLEILLKLGQVKASDNSLSLLNYVAKILRAKDPQLIFFDEKLPSIEAASRITYQVLKAGENAVKKAALLIVTELEQHAKLGPQHSSYSKTSVTFSQQKEIVQDNFQEAVRPFADRASQIAESIGKDLEEMVKVFEDTVAWFGETTIVYGPDSFFSIFSSFAKMLQAADRENERKRIVEEKEKKKRFEKKQKQKNTNQDFVSLKEGDAQEIVLKIRSKRVAEKRKKLMDQRFEERNSLTRRNSNSSL